MGYQLSSLTLLTNLDMNNNNLGGGIPYSLPPNMTRLNLASNYFNGGLPYSISQMVSLDVSHNQLQDQLVDMFGKLSSPSTIDLSFNSLSGNLPGTFSSLSSRSSMYLQNNQFVGTINVLTVLPLKILNVENNRFNGWIPDQLKNINLLKDGNSWNSGSAPPPPPPPCTPSASKNPDHKSGSNNSPSDGAGGGNKSGIGGGAIAGIVISILVVGAIVAFFLIKRRSKRSLLDIEKLDNQPFSLLASNEVQEMKSIQTSSIIKTHSFDTTASINLRPPPIDRR
ncbi:hypothetical protein I3842_03G069900 [Carya illinoinensis]|uniref:Uncharacterized protein n=1 Tax=Carya illinoinensis TaxID=32201 RepID=A0A922FD93_CARIL|nr:hypothetical protein I3842_03G069900 [Carya illinoinensis]